MRIQFSKLALAAGFMLALAFTFSCSGNLDDNPPGGGNQNPQVYNLYYDGENAHIGTPFTGGGIIEVRSGIDAQWTGLRVGTVTNGIIHLNLPNNVPNEYLRDSGSDDEAKRFCTSYTKGIKTFGGVLVLTNNNKDYLGTLQLDAHEYFEGISYMYFSKAGKIACNMDGSTSNIDAKVGWNKLYYRMNITTGTSESSTNNILTKEVKWVLLN